MIAWIWMLKILGGALILYITTGIMCWSVNEQDALTAFWALITICLVLSELVILAINLITL